jgi:hypothetical protein
LRTSAAAVVEQDRRKGTVTLGAKEQCLERDLTAANGNRPGLARGWDRGRRQRARQ